MTNAMVLTWLLIVWSFRLLWLLARLTWRLLWWACYLLGSLIDWSVRTAVATLRFGVLGWRQPR